MNGFVSVKKGDRLKDNDPRMPNRVMVIYSVSEARVFLRNPNIEWDRTSVRRDKIYPAGKTRRSGWSLMESAPKLPKDAPIS